MSSNSSPSSEHRKKSSHLLHRIRVEDIPEEGAEFYFLDRKDSWNVYLREIGAHEFSVDDDVQATVILKVFDQVVRVQGWMDTVLSLQCCRCLESFSYPLTSQIDVTLFPERDRAQDEEVELESDDLKASFFSGEEVDLSGLIREQIILGIPFKPLCRETCKGLCPQCGSNLNEGSCGCEKATGPSAFDALRDLKLNGD